MTPSVSRRRPEVSLCPSAPHWSSSKHLWGTCEADLANSRLSQVLKLSRAQTKPGLGQSWVWGAQLCPGKEPSGARGGREPWAGTSSPGLVSIPRPWLWWDLHVPPSSWDRVTEISHSSLLAFPPLPRDSPLCCCPQGNVGGGASTQGMRL